MNGENQRVVREMEEILKRVDALPPLDDRSEDAILGYDHRGLPADGPS